MMKFKTLLTGAAALMGAAALPAQAGVVTFTNDKVGFDTAAGGAVLTALNFDDIAAGTDITGQNLFGAIITSPDGNTMDVVRAEDTVSFTGNPANSLLATSGENVLSPGGTDLAAGSNILERDSIEINFVQAVAALSFDVLFQSLDAATFVSVQAFAADGSLLVTRTMPGNGAGGGAPAGNVFFGLFSDDPSTHVARIVLTESDGNAIFPDSNIGLDSLRFSQIVMADPVPLPAAMWLFLAGIGGLAGARKRRKA